MGTNVQMRGATTGGNENGLASIDVPMNGNLVGVTWNVNVDFDTDNDTFQGQLSFGSTGSAVNDSRQVISNCMAGVSMPTSAGFVRGDVNYHDPVEIPVNMGERLFLHGLCSATVVAVMNVTLHFDFDLDKVQVRRR